MNLDLPGFESKKAAQAAGFFIAQSKQGFHPIKLNSLLYLAERAFIQKYRHLMFYDALFSTPHGPLCGRIYEGISGTLDQEVWSRYLSIKDGLLVLNRSVEGADLNELLDADLEILEDVWHDFGHLSQDQIQGHFRDHCPEYHQTREACLPISYPELFKILGFERPDLCWDDVQSYHHLKAMISKKNADRDFTWRNDLQIKNQKAQTLRPSSHLVVNLGDRDSARVI